MGDISNNNNLRTLDQLKDQYYGQKGSRKRVKLEKEYHEFRLGALIQGARLEKGLTQGELAEKCGTNKSFISRVENNIKDVRVSTLQRIIELGLDGQLKLSIKLTK